MPYNTLAKRKAYNKKIKVRNRIKRRKYFREYGRRNAARLKAIVLMGDVAKIMKTSRELSEAIDVKTELMRAEQVKLDFKINQIKKFINIK